VGYYVTDGKPASINSFLVPEDKLEYTGSSTYVPVSAPDLDGTWGHNNEGIRFFTAEGVAVEIGGNGFFYQYANAPLPIKVPKLNPPAKE
jgi:hypothetical protein